MRNKFLLLVTAGVLMFLGALTFVPYVSAQAPINTSPQTARYLDNQWQYIPAQTSLWFLFDYAGDRSIAEIILIDGNAKKLQFNVYSPAQISGRQDSTNPVGRGSVPQVNCEAGKCPSNHMLWKSASPEGGTYMVEVVNNNPVGMPYLMWIAGSSVTLRVPPPESPLALRPRPYPAPAQPITTTLALSPTLVPTITTPITATTSITPSNVLFVLGQEQLIVEYGQRWFGFNFPAERNQVEMTIPGGADTHLMMLVYWQDNAPNSEVKFMGEASANAGDLTWIGELSTPGNYFIQVINNNPAAQLFKVIVFGMSPGTRR